MASKLQEGPHQEHLTTSHHNGQNEDNLGGVQSLHIDPDPSDTAGWDKPKRTPQKNTTMVSELPEGPHREHLTTSHHNGQNENNLGGVQSPLKQPDTTESTGLDGSKKPKRKPQKNTPMTSELQEGPHRDHLPTSHHNGQNEDNQRGVQSPLTQPDPTDAGGCDISQKPKKNTSMTSELQEGPHRDLLPTSHHNGQNEDNLGGVQSPLKQPDPTELTGLDGSKKPKRKPQKKNTPMTSELQEGPHRDHLTTSHHNGKNENNQGGVQSLPKEPDPTEAAGGVIGQKCDKIDNGHGLKNGESQVEKHACNGDSEGSSGPCSVCEIKSHLNCSGCGVVYYCGEEHQREHWSQHKEHCLPYKLVSSPAHGRYYVSTRRLSAGQVIFEESAVVDGPQPVSELLCLGCHKLITLIDSEIPRCPKCLWPLCSMECIRAPRHQHECPILATDTKLIGTPKGEGETPRYDIIMALRCLLLKELDPETWKDVLSMPHKSEERLFDQELHEVATVQYLLDVLHIDYPPELVNQMKGIISRNALQIRSEHNTIVRGLYPRISLFKHSCTPNVQLSSIDDRVMKARTTCTVELGEPLCISYTGTMLPLWERQTMLSKSYNINCDCKRCLDPTEIGTHFSSPRCPECKTSFLEPFRWLGKTSWVCPVCKTEESDAKVREGVVEWMERLQMDDLIGGSSIKSATAILEQVEQEFHPTHYLWMRVAQTVLQKLQHSNTHKALRMKRKLWQRLRALYTALEPGLTKRQGMALLETGAAMLLEAKTEYEEGQAYIPVFVKSLPPIVTILQEATKILEMEPLGSQMRTLADTAEAKRKEAQEFIETLSPAESRSQ